MEACVPDPLKRLLVRLALDPDALGQLITGNLSLLAEDLSTEDQEILRAGRAEPLLARLSTPCDDQPGPRAVRHDVRASGGAARRGSLAVVGTGIRSVGQLTVEAIAWIKYADQVLYLVAEPVAENAIRALNPERSHSLAKFYGEGKPRRDTYQEMIAEILATVRSGARTCAVFYGHPGIFVDPAHAAIRQARDEGFVAEMFPGVSAEDCLFADLGIDPATAGCQTYEATDFLVNHRQLDPTSHVVLWQVGVLGDRTFSLSARGGAPLKVLRERLGQTYPGSHELCRYEAAVLPGCRPNVRWFALDAFEKTPLSIVSTIYIPPSSPPRFDLEMYFALTGAG
jgi:precorrin-6B methylase 1